MIIGFLTITILSIFLTGCPSKTANTTSPTAFSKIIGTISTSKAVTVSTTDINPEGGIISVDKPDNPLNGMEITVPPGSYNSNKRFDISYANITGHTFGKYFNPVTPLIKIENGSGYSSELITLKIPVQVKQGYFAMPFLFNSSTGEIQGMPVIEEQDNFVTVATRHFSDVVVTEVDFSDPGLKDTLWDTGFLPGKDDWQFENARSFITPDGLCNGMSLSAMWYYITKPDGNKNLSFTYDNNGNSPATPDFRLDDSLAYRYASVIMDDFFWDAYENKYFRKLDAVDDRATWRSTVSAIMNTKQPQLVTVRKSDENTGHALVVYSAVITGSDEGYLKVSDPNIFGDQSRVITYSNGKFQPYNTEPYTGGGGVLLDKVLFIGKNTMIDYVDCAQRWQEFKNKTIGSNPSRGHPQFPQYTLILTNTKNVKKEIKDGVNVETNDKFYKITAERSGSALLGTQVYVNGNKLTANEDKYYELQPGDNHLGIYIAGKVNDSFLYVDFKYINVVYSDLAIDPENIKGEVDKEYTFKAVTTSPFSNPRYEWSINGSVKQTGANSSFSTKFTQKGEYTLTLKLKDSGGKEIGTASSKVTIEAATPKEYVWKFVEIVDVENKEAWDLQNTDTYYKFDHSYGQGNFSSRVWHQDKDLYVAYGAKAVWSVPPKIIKAGEKVTLTVTLSETENTHKNSASGASASADFASPTLGTGSRGRVDFANATGETYAVINGAGPTSDTETLTAIAPAGRVGERIAIRVCYYLGTSMGTYYVYEWQEN